MRTLTTAGAVDAQAMEITVISKAARDTLIIKVLLHNRIGMIIISDGSVCEISQAATLDSPQLRNPSLGKKYKSLDYTGIAWSQE